MGRASQPIVHQSAHAQLAAYLNMTAAGKDVSGRIGLLCGLKELLTHWTSKERRFFLVVVHGWFNSLSWFFIYSMAQQGQRRISLYRVQCFFGPFFLEWLYFYCWLSLLSHIDISTMKKAYIRQIPLSILFLYWYS